MPTTFERSSALGRSDSAATVSAFTSPSLSGSFESTGRARLRLADSGSVSRGYLGREAMFRSSVWGLDQSLSSHGRFQISDNEVWISRFSDEHWPSLEIRPIARQDRAIRVNECVEVVSVLSTQSCRVGTG
jgi:hypothetical protein